MPTTRTVSGSGVGWLCRGGLCVALGLAGILAPLPGIVAGAPGALAAQTAELARAYPALSSEQIAYVRATLAAMKSSERGPYRRIVWYCNDGTTRLPANGNCAANGGGRQRAEFSEEALRIAPLGFHPGTLLSGLAYEEFLDAGRGSDRLRELVLEHYLIEADGGWVLRRARYYRGARQVEDEEQLGREYLERLFEEPGWLARNALLATRLATVVPHGQPGVPGDRIRRLAERLAEIEPRAQAFRIKVHSRPGPDDLDALEALRLTVRPAPGGELAGLFDALEVDLTAVYLAPADGERWAALARAAGGATTAARVRETGAALAADAAPAQALAALATLLREVRAELDGSGGVAAPRGRVALALMATVLYAESQLRVAAATWLAQAWSATRAERLAIVEDLVDAAYGTGWLSAREHQALERRHADIDLEVPVSVYRDHVRYLQNAVDWSHATLHQAFGAVVERFQPVEPAVRRFNDEMIRASVVLAIANAIDPLVFDANRAAGLRHLLFDQETGSRVVGLNAGIALGTFHVLSDLDAATQLDPEGIYLLPETTADLGRVAGILTLQEGSRLSHMQLLARSLGIPNAQLAPSLLDELARYDGTEVFYAVSNLGAVVLRPRADMNAADLAIVEEQAQLPDELIAIDLDKLDLSARRVVPLEDIDASDSGRIAGPKAANLGHLRRMFPDRVAPGLVIPFGVFRQHIDRDLLGSGRTLYEDLVASYRRAEEMAAAGTPREEVRGWILARLREVREAIQRMDLLPGFEADLRAALERTFGPDGSYGVFVRSDTNVEDLPNFTGAGLNLTVMNQVGAEGILHALTQVWASPFTERSFTWRQNLLQTPEHVYPSVLLLESVPSEASGVLVTADLATGKPDHWTVTVSEGVGGVVDGEPAESALLSPDGGEPVLLSSARAIWQKVLRMTGGGMDRVLTAGSSELLTPPRVADLRQVVGEILERYEPVLDEAGRPMPWDVEFGFIGDRVTLFQIRPLVTNRKVRTLQALTALDQAELEGGGSRILRMDEPPVLQ